MRLIYVTKIMKYNTQNNIILNSEKEEEEWIF